MAGSTSGCVTCLDTQLDMIPGLVFPSARVIRTTRPGIRLISGPLDHLGLFGSSSLVPKQRAVTSTGAYVLMDLRSALDGSGKSLARFYWLQLHCVSGPLVLSFVCGLRHMQPGRKRQASSHKLQAPSIKLLTAGRI